MFCRNCGKGMAEKAVFCVGCGYAPTNSKNFCQNCGQPSDPNAQVCIKCGVKLIYEPFGEAVKSKVAAGLLGIFVGGFGIHRFYLGYTGIGIIQIIVTIFTFGIGGLWGFIEGILILAGTMKKDAQGRLLKED